MRTEELWFSKIRKKAIQHKFPPRLVRDLLQLPPPKIKNPTQISFIYGAVHTGKSVFAAQCLLEFEKQKYLAGQPYRTEFVGASELYEQLKNTFAIGSEYSTEQVMNKYASADYLVIDDFGTNKPTDHVYQVFYLLINHRYENMLPTLVTSNLDLNAISTLFNDDRITNRFPRMGEIREKQHYAHRA